MQYPPLPHCSILNDLSHVLDRSVQDEAPLEVVSLAIASRQMAQTSRPLSFCMGLHGEAGAVSCSGPSAATVDERQEEEGRTPSMLFVSCHDGGAMMPCKAEWCCGDYCCHGVGSLFARQG